MAAVRDWTFEGTWPYEPKWFDSPDGRMHYVDEGPPDGRPVVMVHGNPTWGYLYRNFIPALVEAGHRAIVRTIWGSGARTSCTTPICAMCPGTPSGSTRCWSRSTSAAPWSCHRIGAAPPASTGPRGTRSASTGSSS